MKSDITDKKACDCRCGACHQCTPYDKDKHRVFVCNKCFMRTSFGETGNERGNEFAYLDEKCPCGGKILLVEFKNLHFY
jgi:hypothetical protein